MAADHLSSDITAQAGCGVQQTTSVYGRRAAII
jgi:hypothetical protein